MKQTIEMLIIASYKWSENPWIRRLFLHLEATSMHYFAVNSLCQAKEYLNKHTMGIILISDNLVEDIDGLEDEKSLGLKFYEELKNDPKYTSIPIIIQSFSEYSSETIKLREIDFYYSTKTTCNELDKFINKFSNETTKNP